MTLAACGLLLFATSSRANWLVAGTELTSNETVSIKPHKKLVLKVQELKLEIQCTAISGSITLLASSAKGEGTVKYSTCTTFSPIESGTENKNCKPSEPIEFGVVLLIILHNSKNYILLDPKGSKFGTIKFSELCALTETADITGTRVDECGHLVEPPTPPAWVFLDCFTALTEHLLRPAPKALFTSDKLKFGNKELETDEIDSWTLSGANAGKQWAAHV